MRFSTHILTMMLATMLVHSVIIINFFLTYLHDHAMPLGCLF